MGQIPIFSVSHLKSTMKIVIVKDANQLYQISDAFFNLRVGMPKVFSLEHQCDHLLQSFIFLFPFLESDFEFQLVL